MVEFDEPEPPADDPGFVPAFPVLARTVVGVNDASVCADDDARADVVDEDRELLLVFESALLAEEERGEPDVGVSVACDPLLVAAVRPETLCACVDVPADC